MQSSGEYGKSGCGTIVPARIAPIDNTSPGTLWLWLIHLAQAHPDWALGFGDEVWWSRVARPHLASWADDGTPLRLVERAVARDDPDPKALARYGLLMRHWNAVGKRAEQLWLRFVDGRPVSGVTTQFLDWCCARLAAAGKSARTAPPFRRGPLIMH